ncbi:MAG: sensor histidine kinase [Verrucomicrobia bacterium]|nr:sensor histidine kinase [Verrucomicrobiota bacterium]
MSNALPWLKRFARARAFAPLVIALTVALLGGVIVFARQQVRHTLRAQLAGRDGEILHAVTQMQQMPDDTGAEPLADITDPAEQLNLVLKTSRLKGVMAVRLFTAGGKFANAIPANVTEARLDAETLAQLRALKPVSRFHEAARLDEIFLLLEPPRSPAPPVLEVNIPLHADGARTLAGCAQFIIEGQSLAAEYATLDRHLWRQSLLAFLGGGAVLVLGLGWAFRQLAAHTADLERANRELALAARSSAVGAVAAHLVHGLKNPLFGLHNFVTSRGQENEAAPSADWELAADSARRMTALINEVMAVLREEPGAPAYEVSVAELAELVTARVRAVADAAGVRFKMETTVAVTLTSRTANLAALILANLLHNAIQATPRGRTVTFSARENGGALEFSVADEGPGVPAEMRARLFTPCASSKPGGGGLGLAISKQLANHLGAALELKGSSAAGCHFALILPLENAGESAVPAGAPAAAK